MTEPQMKAVHAHYACTCCRCKHSWQTVKMERPRICPKCKSAYWDVPRKQKPEEPTDMAG